MFNGSEAVYIIFGNFTLIIYQTKRISTLKKSYSIHYEPLNTNFQPNPIKLRKILAAI